MKNKTSSEYFSKRNDRFWEIHRNIDSWDREGKMIMEVVVDFAILSIVLSVLL